MCLVIMSKAALVGYIITAFGTGVGVGAAIQHVIHVIRKGV